MALSVIVLRGDDHQVDMMLDSVKELLFEDVPVEETESGFDPFQPFKTSSGMKAELLAKDFPEPRPLLVKITDFDGNNHAVQYPADGTADDPDFILVNLDGFIS